MFGFLQYFPAVLAIVLIAWALTARRSRTDAALIWLAAALLLITALYPFLRSPDAILALVRPALVPLGIFMLIRIFFTPLGTGHKVGLAGAGCAVTLPFVASAAIVAVAAYLFSHPHSPPVATNSAAPR